MDTIVTFDSPAFYDTGMSPFSVVISVMVKSGIGRRFTRMDADPEKNLRLSA
jgi:hypothetical protein